MERAHLQEDLPVPVVLGSFTRATPARCLFPIVEPELTVSVWYQSRYLVILLCTTACLLSQSK
ncbi:hypothetical protein L484_017575 [Morus notabilis]|uniref:Uncharacterized protein n=1 Tax=Morus notabilis TaxID=981085 RepID=W9R038_9ROSA|nr:hypothetical protein L484_017575 [Morus notabilis]